MNMYLIEEFIHFIKYLLKSCDLGQKKYIKHLNVTLNIFVERRIGVYVIGVKRS